MTSGDSEHWRARRAREAMLGAATDLLRSEGPTALTHQRIAERAGVGRATVYRHWATTEELMFAVVAQLQIPWFLEPAEDLATLLRRDLSQAAYALSSPEFARMTAGLIAQRTTNPAMAQVIDGSLELIRGRLVKAMAQALETGEITSPATVATADAVLSQLLGPLLYDAFILGTIDRARLDQNITDVMRGLRTASSATSATPPGS